MLFLYLTLFYYFFSALKFIVLFSNVLLYEYGNNIKFSHTPHDRIVFFSFITAFLVVVFHLFLIELFIRILPTVFLCFMHANVQTWTTNIYHTIFFYKTYR